MVTNTKHTMNKSCSCSQCRRGRGSEFGKLVRNKNNRKLRRRGKQELAAVRDGVDVESVSTGAIGSPYTD